MQTELLDRQRWRTRIELANAIFEYIEGFYNRRRRHSALNWKSPIDFETTTHSPDRISSPASPRKPGQYQDVRTTGGSSFRPGGEGPPDPPTYEAKLASLAATIIGIGPDVLAVQEVGDPAALDDLWASWVAVGMWRCRRIRIGGGSGWDSSAATRWVS